MSVMPVVVSAENIITANNVDFKFNLSIKEIEKDPSGIYSISFLSSMNHPESFDHFKIRPYCKKGVVVKLEDKGSNICNKLVRSDDLKLLVENKNLTSSNLKIKFRAFSKSNKVVGYTKEFVYIPSGSIR